jgi:hypothetical protein
MRPLLGVLLLAVVALVGLELALPSGGHWPPGAAPAFGLVGCAVVVGIAKGLARLGLQRTDATDE